MIRSSALILALVVTMSAPVLSQQQPVKPQDPPAPPQQKPQTKPSDDQDVVRISVTLVQLDAVVTDEKGRPVTDLKREDFEVYEDNRKQTISNFSYVSTAAVAAPEPAAPATPLDRTAPPVPPTRLEPGQIRRTVAFVIDDLSLSFESMYSVRESLKKFVDQQMQPGDLVAIVRTGAGMGALQQFTSDKRMLYAAIDRVRFNMMGRGRISAFAPIESSPATSSSETSTEDSSEETTADPDEIATLREQLFSVGTLGAVNFVVRSLKELPGRKSIILMSDGFQMFTPNGDNDRVLIALRQLVDLANRAAVVIYTLDARGLQPLGLTAADNVSGMSAQQVQDSLSSRRDEYFDTQSGLGYLAAETGGFFIHDNNDLSGGVNKVLNDQAGYYLLGYVPEEGTFKASERGRKFHKLQVKVKRPGLRVRYRSGFFGISDDEPVASESTDPRTRLISALTSPFGSGGVRLKLTSLFGNDPKSGSFVRSLVHIDARDLTFSEEADGWHKAVFNFVALTFGDNGQVIDQAGRTFTITTRGEEHKAALERGLVCTMDIPIKKPGAYQLRTAVRDSGSERIGSASQFIEVPDIKKDRVLLSGIVVTSGVETDKNASDDSPKPTTGSISSPAVRIFADGSSIRYAFFIYNARVDDKTKTPQLETQVRVFKEGKPIYTGPFRSYNPTTTNQLKRLAAVGSMKLGPGLTPGQYVLQIIVKDKLAKEKNRFATQWIDLEVTK